MYAITQFQFNMKTIYSICKLFAYKNLVLFIKSILGSFHPEQNLNFCQRTLVCNLDTFFKIIFLFAILKIH
jgi:hypothetical protein